MSGAGEKVAVKWRGSPSSEYRFFLYDPEGDGFMFFASAEDRAKLAPSIIGKYCDDGWSEEVSCVCAGEVTHSIAKTDVSVKPVRGDFETTAEFEDALDEWPCSDFDEICNYELAPLADSQRDALLTRLSALEAREKVLREALENAAHRVRWLMQFANVDKEPIDQELAHWSALATGETK